MGILKSMRLDERKEGKEIIENLKKYNRKTLIVHYSCESFFNLNGRTPRVTSVCIKNRGNNTTKTFSIHIHAQILRKDFLNLSDADYDFIEKQMLKDFFAYMKVHSTHYWVHWHMRNASYGFEAIANRYRILGGNPKELEDQFRIDLPEVIRKIYTYDFEKDKPDGKLLNLSTRNKISIRDALKGKDEAKAFEDRDYLLLHMSTSRKVELIDEILTLEEKGNLKVVAPAYKVFGLTPKGIFEIVRNNWILLLLFNVIVFIMGVSVEPLITKKANEFLRVFM